MKQIADLSFLTAMFSCKQVLNYCNIGVRAISFLFLLALISTSCEKRGSETSLKIKVIDTSKHAVVEASVRLFNNESDMINNINQLGTSQTTGSDGTVFFSDLSPDQLYAYRVETGCRNSLLQWTDTATSYDMLRLPLQSGVENEVVAYVVRAGATLKLVNNGPMTYHLGALRSFFRILKPYETTTHHFFLDDYFINVTSPNAPTFSLDTVLSLRCGEITTLTLP